MSAVSKVLAALAILLGCARGTALDIPGFPLVQAFVDEDLFRNNGGIASITQLPDGTMLMGAMNEVYALDGRRWAPMGVKGLEYVVTLGCDRDGTLVAGAYESPGYFKVNEQGWFEFVSLRPLMPKSVEGARIFSRLAIATDGVYYVSQHTVVRWDRRQQVDTWPSSDVFPYVFAMGESAYISIGGSGLFRVNGTALEPVPGGEAADAHAQPDKVTGAIPFRDGWLMITERDGFRFFDGRRITRIELPGSSMVRDPKAQFIFLLKTGNGGFVAADTRSRILFFDGEGNTIGQWKSDDYPGITTTSVFVDRDGKTWTAASTGLLRLELDPGVRVLDNRTRWEALPTGILADGNRRLFSTQTSTYEWVQGEIPGSGSLRTVQELGIVLGVFGDDVFYTPYDGDFLLCRRADGRVEQIMPRGAWRVFPGRFDADVAYVMDVPQRLYAMRRTDGKWRITAGPVDTPVRVVEITEGVNNFWFTLGHDRVARAAKEPFLSGFTVYDQTHKLPQDWIRPFFAGDKVVFATRQGVYAFDAAKSVFSPDPRFSDVPKSISGDFRTSVTDPFGNIWVSSPRGSAIMRPQPDGSYRWDLASLSVLGGMTIQQMSWDAAGWMWCGTRDRLYGVSPEIRQAPASVLHALVAEVRDLKAGQVLFGSQRRGGAASLEYAHNSLQFEVSAPEYSAPDSVEFQVRLWGRETAWSNWTGSRVYSFPGLSEGQYAFEYRARDAYGRIAEGVPFAFVITPPIYRTLGAYLLYAALLLGLIWGSARYYTRRLQARNIELDRLVQARTAALEKAQRELIDSSRLAGMAEVAIGILHNVGNALNSLNISASIVTDEVRRFGEHFTKLAGLFKQHHDDLPQFLERDPKGKLVPQYLEMATEQAIEQRKKVLGEMTVISTGIDQLKEIVVMQQEYAGAGGFAEALDAALLFDDALAIVQAKKGGESVRIVREFIPGTRVLGQRGKIIHILEVLIENAFEACRESSAPTVTLTVRPGNEKRVQMSVQDNGAEIKQDDLARIFAQGGEGGAPRGSHLHSCANAATELGGNLTAHNAESGGGAVFTVELPAAAASPANAEPQSPLLATANHP